MVIIDASVANKLFLPNEEYNDKAVEIFLKHAQKIEAILIPDLLFYEVANTLSTKTAIPLSKITRSLAELYEFDLEAVHPSQKEMLSAAKMAKTNHVSVYDAIYAVLAKEKNCNLITADEKFVEIVNLKFVKKLKET